MVAVCDVSRALAEAWRDDPLLARFATLDHRASS
jgi:hypothetical protein